MTSSTHRPNAARSPVMTQGLGVAYATGAIISAQFGAALAKQLMGDLGPWGVVTLRLRKPFPTLPDLLGNAAGYPKQSGDPLPPFRIGRPRDGVVDQHLDAGHDRYG